MDRMVGHHTGAASRAIALALAGERAGPPGALTLVATCSW
jgi:hypothetical protein